MPYAYSQWGWILSWAGRPAEGVCYSERAITMFQSIGIKMFLSQRYVEWAEGLLLDGKISDARRVAEWVEVRGPDSMQLG